MKNITISKAHENDTHEIQKLQELLLLKNKKYAASGFLVSAFTEKDYTNFIEKYDHFYVAKIDNEICGILMAYHSSKIDRENKTNMLLKYSTKTDFILIKQIFVSPKYSSKGIASKLYKYLFSAEKKDLPFIAVIVSNPVNVASYKFHKKYNFTNYLEFEPDADKDKVVRSRSAWIRLPNSENDLSKHIRFTNQKKIDDFGETIMSRSSDYVSLYTHEDNLNWTKMGLQITLIFALFASFIYFYEKELIPESLPIVIILAIWGLTINLVFFLKIRSGLKYMMKHKENIKNFDQKIKLYFPVINPVFPNESYISKKSITMKLLPILSLLGLISWLVVSLLLIFKGLNIFSISI